VIIIKKPAEINLMREGGRICAQALEDVIAMTVPGLETIELEKKGYRDN
jgi:methionine aminopeptidase